MQLKFSDLRHANKLRLPQFRNKHGQPAHSKPDGSDWSVAQWFQALVGEVGEFAEARIDFEHGNTNVKVYAEQAQNELADVATYLDLLARRALDATQDSTEEDRAQILMVAMAHIGAYANAAKKQDRGDLTEAEFKVVSDRSLLMAVANLNRLFIDRRVPNNATIFADSHGVVLDAAIIHKFNVVSARVGSNIGLLDRGPCSRSDGKAL